MNGTSSVRLQDLLDKLATGDDAARREIVGHTYERLRLIASRMFKRSFPRLARFHESGSVADEAGMQIQKALSKVHPPTGADYYRWAGHQIRWVLLEMCRQLDRRPVTVSLDGGRAEEGCDMLPLFDGVFADTCSDPADLAVWAEFHRRVAELPEEERIIVDCLWYHGLSQKETAELLGVPYWQVHRRWTDVRLKLAQFLPHGESPPTSPDEEAS